MFGNEKGANATTGSYNLDFRGNFSKKIESRLTDVEKQFAVAYSQYDPFPYNPNTSRFMGRGEVATNNLRKLLGKDSVNYLTLGRIGAHESGHFFLQLFGHHEGGLMRVYDQTLTDPTKDKDFRFNDAEAAKLSTLCP